MTGLILLACFIVAGLSFRTESAGILGKFFEHVCTALWIVHALRPRRALPCLGAVLLRGHLVEPHATDKA
jgi:hypothetical protein